jgi:hypothetical protein
MRPKWLKKVKMPHNYVLDSNLDLFLPWYFSLSQSQSKSLNPTCVRREESDPAGLPKRMEEV